MIVSGSNKQKAGTFTGHWSATYILQIDSKQQQGSDAASSNYTYEDLGQENFVNYTVLSLISAILLAPQTKSAPEPEIAFAARYYAPGKTRSYSQIYICRADGTQRRQLTQGNTGNYGVMWLDHNHLAWAECADVPKLGDNSEKPRQINVVALDLTTNKRTVLGTLKSTDPQPQVDSEKRELYFYNFDGKTSEYISYEVSLNGLVKGKKEFNTPPFGTPIDENSGDSALKATVTVPGTESPYTFTFEPWKQNRTSIAVKIERNGEAKSFKLPSELIQSATLGPDQTLLAITEPMFNKSDMGQFLTVIDFAKGTSKTVVRRLGNITLAPDQIHYFANQPEPQPTTPLPEKRRKGDRERTVWTNQLFAGNWKTGKTHAIATGPVYVTSSQYRPE